MFEIHDYDVDYLTAKTELWELFEACGGTPKEESRKYLKKFADENGYSMTVRVLEEFEDEILEVEPCDYMVILTKHFGKYEEQKSLVFMFDEDGVLTN